ncbi:MAG: MFS transporter [Gammaproteobacteria bacterium]|nr:MFS transporter [Gammaproteobacteria bacterium]
MSDRSVSALHRTSYQLTWYNSGNALWMGSFSIQQLLVIWILVGVLHETPERVGFAQMLISIPGLIFMLWGGVIGDRRDGRQLLIQAHYLSAIPPLVLAIASIYGLIGFWLLVATALSAGLLNSASNPARNTILNIVAGKKLQFAISFSTGIGSIASIAGTKVAGELDTLGLENVLYLQAAMFILGAFFVARLAPVPPQNQVARKPAIDTIRDGLTHVWNFKLARDLIGLNCLSGFFNAGAWLVAVPFIITRVYAGDAVLLANLTAVFYFGSLVANFGLLRFMPLVKPGRLYLIMQLSRIPVLAILWLEPDLWLVWAAIAYWGFNMGITTTTSRLMVQEFASPEYRARIMSIYILGMMSAVPVGSLVLGFIIGIWGPLDALIPGMVASALVFFLGWRTDIWEYRSPDPGNS